MLRTYAFKDIEVGLRHAFTKRVTAEDLDIFRRITGDTNPLHADEAFARAKGFDGKVVFGMLTASLLSTLAGVHLPGRDSLILSVETSFTRPCYEGDTLTVEGTVVEKKEFANIIKLRVAISNQQRKTVLRGSMLVKVQE